MTDVGKCLAGVIEGNIAVEGYLENLKAYLAKKDVTISAVPEIEIVDESHVRTLENAQIYDYRPHQDWEEDLYAGVRNAKFNRLELFV